MRRRELLILYGVFFAGCTGRVVNSTESPPGTKSGSPTGTKTPSQSPSSTPALSLDEASLPQGVSTDKISANLVSTHQKLILNKSYTLDISRIMHSSETERRRSTIQLGMDSVHQEQSASGAPSKSFWKDKNEGFAYAEGGGGDFYMTVSPEFDRNSIAQLEYLRALITSGQFKPIDVVREDGSPVIQAEAMDGTASGYLSKFGPPDQPPVGSIDSFSGTLKITLNGLIRNLSVDWTYLEANGSQTFREELEYSVSRVDETEVTAPDWVNTARNEAVSFDERISDNRKYIIIDIQGKGSLPDNWAVFVSTNSGLANPPGPLTIEADGGDTVYIGLTDQNEMEIGINEKPSDVRILGDLVFLHLSITGVIIFDREL